MVPFGKRTSLHHPIPTYLQLLRTISTSSSLFETPGGGEGGEPNNLCAADRSG